MENNMQAMELSQNELASMMASKPKMPRMLNVSVMETNDGGFLIQAQDQSSGFKHVGVATCLSDAMMKCQDLFKTSED